MQLLPALTRAYNEASNSDRLGLDGYPAAFGEACCKLISEGVKYEQCSFYCPDGVTFENSYLYYTI